jgi:type IV pilus assembly protein PilE
MAIPGYRQYVIRTNRTEAKATLMSTASAYERCYTRFNRYDDAGCTVPAESISSSGKYKVTPTALDAASFTLTAAPQDTQANDTRCGNFTLTDAGVRGVSGTQSVADCWGK